MTPKCCICNKPVAKTHRAVNCDGCKQWCHIKCGNVTPKDYIQLSKLNEFDWCCPNCVKMKSNISRDLPCEDVATEPNLAFVELAKDIKKYRGLSIAHLNINGLYPKLNQIEVLLEETAIDIFAISETHLHSGISDDEIKIKDYEILRRDRVNNAGWGGVLIYHKESLHGIEFKTNVNDLEMVWLECTVRSQKILISCLYKPPRNKATFLDKFDQIIGNINEKRTNFVILGDFNIDLLGEPNNDIIQFNLLLKKHQLYNIVKQPTRITETSATLIDHIVIPKQCQQKINNVHAIDPGLSDHHIIYCSINILSPRKKPIYRTVKNYKNVNIDQLKQDIRTAPWLICDVFDDVDDIVSVWEKLYNTIVNSHIQERKVKMRAHSHPWINSAIRKQLNNRYKLLKVAQKTAKGSHEWKIYKKAKNYCTNLLRVAEANYWKDKFNNLHSSSKEFWNCINEFTGKTKTNKIGPLEDSAGNLTNNNKIKSKILNDYFANIGKLDKNPTNAQLQSHLYRVTPTIDHIPYHQGMLTTAFKQVFKKGKSSGHDGVDAKTIRLIGDDILEGFHYIAKGSFTTLKFPTSYKTAKVSCILKKGSKVKSENYRPISLLSLPGKMLESIFSVFIDSHIIEHDLISKHQWGFRKGRSPELMLLNLMEKLLFHLGKGQYVGLICIDFSKAFDSVCHTTLLKKLQAIGISGDSFEWSNSYLSDRKQFTKVNGERSDLASVDQGVPQGSLLGPRFYSYHVNDLPEVTNSIKQHNDQDQVEMFADDTNGITTAPSYDLLIAQLQHLAAQLHDWSYQNGMIIHPGKTKIIVFSHKAFIGPAPDITLNGRSLEIVESHKVLGTTIDSKLSWKTHVDKTVSQFNAKVKLLQRMRSLSNNVLERFYFATIIPTVTYNISVWGQPDKFGPLEEIHVKAAKIIHRLPSNLSNYETLDIVKWMPLSYIYKRRLLCLMHKVYYKQIDKNIQSMFSHENNKMNLSRQQQLVLNRKTNLKLSFSYKAVKIWNRMPNELTETTCHKTFKQKLSKFKSKINSYSFNYNSYNIDDDFIFY